MTRQIKNGIVYNFILAGRQKIFEVVVFYQSLCIKVIRARYTLRIRYATDVLHVKDGGNRKRRKCIVTHAVPRQEKSTLQQEAVQTTVVVLQILREVQ